MSIPSSTPAPVISVPLAAPALPPYTEEEERWIGLRDSLDPVQHLPLDINSAFYPSNTSVHIFPAIDEAFNAGLMTGTGVSTNFTFVNLPRSSAGMHCQSLIIMTTTSTDPIFAIFPGYQLQFSGFGTEGGFHGTSFTSRISWCPWILGIFTIRRVIRFLLLGTVLILFPGEYLPPSGAEISIPTGVVTRTGR